MPKSAPDASTAPVTQTDLTIHLIDASGDLFTANVAVPGAITPAQAEAVAVAYGAATQADVYKTSLTQQWAASADPANALVGQRNSIADGINFLYKNSATLRSVTPRLIAPVAAVMTDNTDIPIPTATEITDLLTAYNAILTGYDVQSVQFTERRERRGNTRRRV